MTKRLLVVEIYCHAIIVPAILSYPLAAFIFNKVRNRWQSPR